MMAYQHPKPKGNESDKGISPKVYHLAQVLYQEFDYLQRTYGEAPYGNLVPIAVNVLEEMDLVCCEKQRLNLELNSILTERSDLIAQLEREKMLHLASKKRIHCLEDEILVIKKESDDKLESVESEMHHYQLVARNSNEHVCRLEEREIGLRNELSSQNERYAELLKSYVELIERTKTFDSNSVIQERIGTFERRPVDEIDSYVDVKTPTNTRPGSAFGKNTSNIEDGANLEFDLTILSPSNSHDLHNEIKATNRASSFVDFYDDSLDYESALETASTLNADDDTEELSMAAQSNEATESSGMIKEVEKLIKENVDLCETKNALNILKDDLIKKLDEVTGEKIMLTQELHGLRVSRDNIRAESNRLSNLVHKCMDQISSLSARLKVYEDMDEGERYLSNLHLHQTPLQHSTSCWVLSAGEDEQREINKQLGKSVDNLNSSTKNVPVAKTFISTNGGESHFTKREMARVIAERNNYKEKFLELQDAVRLADEIRISRQTNYGLGHYSTPNHWDYPGRNTRGASLAESFLNAIQTAAGDITYGLVELFSATSTLDNALPSEAQFVGPTEAERFLYNRTGFGLERDGSTLHRMFGRFFGCATAYTTEATLGTGNDLVVQIGSEPLSKVLPSSGQ